MIDAIAWKFQTGSQWMARGHRVTYANALFVADRIESVGAELVPCTPRCPPRTTTGLPIPSPRRASSQEEVAAHLRKLPGADAHRDRFAPWLADCGAT